MSLRHFLGLLNPKILFKTFHFPFHHFSKHSGCFFIITTLRVLPKHPMNCSTDSGNNITSFVSHPSSSSLPAISSISHLLGSRPLSPVIAVQYPGCWHKLGLEGVNTMQVKVREVAKFVALV